MDVKHDEKQCTFVDLDRQDKLVNAETVQTDSGWQFNTRWSIRAMNKAELLHILAGGEDSRNQFKSNIANVDSMASELAAFANSGGGRLFLGVNDDGSVTGLDTAGVKRLNQLLSNAATQNVHPPVHSRTENIQTPNGIVMVVSVPDGIAKPYIDNHGQIWIKQGADKRHVTAREEIQRMFQRAGLVYADVVPVSGTSAADIDDNSFNSYLDRRYGQSLDPAGQTRDQLLQNLGLGDGHELNPRRTYAVRTPATALPSGF